MPELGEAAVMLSELVAGGDNHDETVCPWHEKGDPTASAEPMDLPSKGLRSMPANRGKALGERLGPAPLPDQITVKWPRPGREATCPLQWAPHHLIPGNASLKGSAVVPYLGDATVIKNYKGTTKIEEKGTVGYDVNDAANGVWLPSPYALSMKSNWPTDEDEKQAYATAAMKQGDTGNRQFHFAHTDYSNEVLKALKAIANRLKLLSAGGKCREAPSSSQPGKYKAPHGLKGRLNHLSDQLRILVTGPVWRPPFFTDSLAERHAANLPKTTSKGELTAVRLTGK